MANDIKVFPVPADDVLHITTTLATKAAVFNVLGQQVWAGDVARKAEINVAGWAKGVYFVRITETGTGNQTVKQVIVQ